MGREACPSLFLEALVRFMNRILKSTFTLFDSTDYSGGYCEEATPDPIPNSEVKLLSADGTA